MAKYRKLPIEVEAIKFNGSSTHKDEIRDWMDGGKTPKSGAVHTRDLVDMGIYTLEGVMTACPGDYIIKGIKGEFYPCKPSIFESSYEVVDV